MPLEDGESAVQTAPETETFNDSFICGTKVTIETVQKALLTNVGIPADKQDKFTLENWSAVRIGLGQGFLSHIIRVCLAWEPADAVLPASVVLKVPTMQTVAPLFENMMSDSGMSKQKIDHSMISFQEVLLPIVHANECNIYNDFTSRGGPKATPTPKIYYTQTIGTDHPGLIIMEDLADKGALVNLPDGLRLAQVLQIAEALASLHAYSLEYDDWKNNLQDLPRDGVTDEMFSGGLKLVEASRPEFKGKLEKILPFATEDYVYATMKCYEELGLPPVLVHGDLWTNNMLFEKNDKELNKAGDRLLAIIDWQTARAGVITDDFGRLLVMSCSGELRRAEGRNVLKHYYDTLCSLLATGVAPFSFDTVLKAYDRVLIHSLLGFVPALPAFEKTPLVEGPDKQAIVSVLYKRGLDIVDDVLQLL